MILNKSTKQTLFTGSFLYTGCIVCIKLSILALYCRLFPTKLMKGAVYTVGMIVILWGFGVCLVGAFICIPVKKLWEPTVEGGCLNLGEYYYGLQIPNIITDAIILIMPTRIVWGLPISKTQKSLLSGIFVVGIVTFAFDIVRLVALIDLSKSGDDATCMYSLSIPLYEAIIVKMMLIFITDNEVQSSVWTCIEPAVGITAACLSNMRPLFKVSHDKVWVNLTSTFRSKRIQSQTKSESNQSLHNTNSELIYNSVNSRYTDKSNKDTAVFTDKKRPEEIGSSGHVSPKMEA